MAPYDEDDYYGDPRRCPAHPDVVTSSPDGMFDAPCGKCEYEGEEDTSPDPMFRDSTPAPNLDGTYPTPWRVSDPRVASALAVSLGFLDAYSEPAGHDVQGRIRLWVGLRDNHNATVHVQRLEDLAGRLRALGYDIAPVLYGGRTSALYIVDNEPAGKDAYWRRAAGELNAMADAVATMEPDDDFPF